MKILYFHQYFTTPKGSSGTRSYEFAVQLIKQGHDVTIVCGRNNLCDTGLKEKFSWGKRAGTVDGIRVIEYDMPYSNYDNYFKRSFIFIKYSIRGIIVALQMDYDLIIASSTPLTAALPGIVARWIRRKPFVFEVRDLWPQLPEAMGVINSSLILKILRILEWLAYHSASGVIGLSPGIVDGIKNRGVKSELIRMIPNGCDLHMFNINTQQFRPRGLTKNDFVAVYTGAHGLANGLDSAIDAAAVLIKRSRIDIKFVFVGDGGQKPRLIKMANDKNLDNCVFLKPMAKLELVKLLKAADVGLMLLSNIPEFYYGTSPNKFFDYIAAGIPVLNNYPGWIAENIQEFSCGVVVPPDDPESFADGLIFLADNPNLRISMKKNALKLAKNRFDRTLLAQEFTSFLEENVQ